jgi:hypothetical protein
MERILSWPPIFWTGRIVLLIVLLGGGWTALLYLAGFFRPRHMRALLAAGLPVLRSFSGSAQILGQKIEARATLDGVRDGQMERLDERVTDLEARQQRTVESLKDLVHQVDHVRNRLPPEGA